MTRGFDVSVLLMLVKKVGSFIIFCLLEIMSQLKYSLFCLVFWICLLSVVLPDWRGPEIRIILLSLDSFSQSLIYSILFSIVKAYTKLGKSQDYFRVWCDTWAFFLVSLEKNEQICFIILMQTIA